MINNDDAHAFGMSPLDYAVRRGDLNDVKLLATGGKFKICDTTIQFMITSGLEDIFSYLMGFAQKTPSRVLTHTFPSYRDSVMYSSHFVARRCVVCVSTETAVAYRCEWALKILLDQERNQEHQCPGINCHDLVCVDSLLREKCLSTNLIRCLWGYKQSKFVRLFEVESYDEKMYGCAKLLLDFGADPLYTTVSTHPRLHKVGGLLIALETRNTRLLEEMMDLVENGQRHRIKECYHLLEVAYNNDPRTFVRLIHFATPEDCRAIFNLILFDLTIHDTIRADDVMIIDMLILSGVKVWRRREGRTSMTNILRRSPNLGRVLTTFHQRIDLFTLVKSQLKE